MRRYLLGLLMLSGSYGTAVSADLAAMPVKAAVPVYSGFTGFYFGGNIAGAKTDGNFNFLLVPGTGELKPSGFMAGATVGAGAWVNGFYLGVEADGDYDFTKQNTTCVLVLDCKMKSSWALNQRVMVGWALGSLTGQVADKVHKPVGGWPVPLALPAQVAAANIMPFITGGIAERRFEACVDRLCGQEWLVGPAAGGGVRIPISANFSMDITYLHTWYNKSFAPSPGGPFLNSNFKATAEDSLMTHLIAHF